MGISFYLFLGGVKSQKYNRGGKGCGGNKKKMSPNPIAIWK